MEFGKGFLCLFFLVFLSCFLSVTEAYKFYVGGREGWVVKPSENYIHWAERNRFQVNDTLYFKYNKGSDSVLVVNKDSYFNCNTTNPIQKLEDGNSEFKFDRSGPFYFISGKDGSCAKGQKLIVIVLAVRHRKTPTAQPPSATLPPQGSPPAYSPSQGSAPAAVPSSSSSPTPSPTPSPSSSPSQGPSSSSPSPSPSNAPIGTSPTASPVSPPPSPVGPSASIPSGETPSGNVTSPPPGSNQDSTAPANSNKNGSSGVTASGVLVSSVIVLVSLVLMSNFS